MGSGRGATGGGAPGVPGEIRRPCSVAADDHGAASVVEAVSASGLHRLMIDADRGDAQFALIEDRCSSFFTDLDAARATLRARRRQGLLAVMRDAIAGVECVGSLEAADHLHHTGRTVEG